MKVALVYDRVNKFGGAERVLLALHDIWPDAPLFTAVYDSSSAPWAKNFEVRYSWLQNFPFAKTNHEIFPWLMPFVFESFNFDDFDVVISVTSAEAKGIITKPNTLHICYCLTPTRYLWSSYDHYLANPQYGFLNPLAKLSMRLILDKLKAWDKLASLRPDNYIAISKTVAQRIYDYYHQKSEIIYPGVDMGKFTLTNNLKSGNEYFLVVSRLVSYKRIDLIIKAFNKLHLPLIIIGTGKEKKLLESLARPNIKFVDSHLTDSQLLSYYQNCSALISSVEEDLGLVSLEAQACGKPVIGFKIGGTAETIIEGKTGLNFYPQSEEALINAVINFKSKKFNPKDCRDNAKKFSKDYFINKFKSYVEAKWQAQIMK